MIVKVMVMALMVVVVIMLMIDEGDQSNIINTSFISSEATAT